MRLIHGWPRQALFAQLGAGLNFEVIHYHARSRQSRAIGMKN